MCVCTTSFSLGCCSILVHASAQAWTLSVAGSTGAVDKFTADVDACHAYLHALAKREDDPASTSTGTSTSSDTTNAEAAAAADNDGNDGNGGNDDDEDDEEEEEDEEGRETHNRADRAPSPLVSERGGGEGGRKGCV